MPLTQQLLLASTVAFIAAMVQALLALKSGAWRKGPTAQLLLMALGFGLQTAFLYVRGGEVGQCPMKSLPDVLVFIGWSIVLLYFLIGSGFRLSLQGLFTAPIVTVMNAMALLKGFGPYLPKPVSALIELHIALALVAYAAFALACVTGIMYLIQERMLKLHHIGGLFYQLPPIQGLAHAIQRLVRLGLFLLSAALGISFFLHLPMTKTGHVFFAWIVWTLYAITAFLMWRHFTSPRRTAWLAVIGFVLPFISLWIITHA